GVIPTITGTTRATFPLGEGWDGEKNRCRQTMGPVRATTIIGSSARHCARPGTGPPVINPEGARHDDEVGRHPTVAAEHGFADPVGFVFEGRDGRVARAVYRRGRLQR